ncbi:MAG: PLDc_N domain-containing protein [Bacteroidetes bacterium]|nr:PLDc_N domain-containing protein [Bacteroidota bacterium]
MEIILIMTLSFLTLILVFWALIDIVRSRFINPNMRTGWLVVVLFFPIIGSILYFQMRKTLTTNETLKFNPKFKNV